MEEQINEQGEEQGNPIGIKFCPGWTFDNGANNNNEESDESDDD